LIDEVGPAAAHQLWDISVEALDLIRERVSKHAIDCDLHWGHLHAAIKPRHRAQLAQFRDEVARDYGYDSLSLLERADVEALLATERYRAGLYDSRSGHLQPLAYTLGLARAAATAGAQIYTHSPVMEVKPGARVQVVTAHGSVSAPFAVLCCNAYMGALVPALSARTVPAVTYLAATQQLAPGRLQDIIRQNISVADANFVLDYFRRSSDERLLFGGRVSYSGMSLLDIARIIRTRMLRVFPQLADVSIEYAWSGKIDLTVNRAPDFNRLAPNIYYMQGFSGHGLALAGMGGKIVASAIAGQAERFDLFAKLEHRAFPGGNLLRAPALALAMLWYRLRDSLP
jgi:gamma-glutamylputrescine oxidase